MDLVEYQNHFPPNPLARHNQCSPASPPNPSEGLGDKGQGWRARQLCDDVIARIFSRELRCVQPGRIHRLAWGLYHRPESGLGSSELRRVALLLRTHKDLKFQLPGRS